MIEHLHGTTFDWLSWQGGTITKLGLCNRENIIITNANVIRMYAIGYCEGEQLLCRPKNDTIAIMFLKDDEFFWTHFPLKEFNIIFPCIHKMITIGHERDDNMTESEDAAWLAGYRASTMAQLRECIQKLGYNCDEKKYLDWITERENAIAILREACANHGDNAWDSTLNLADIIDKHLVTYL